MSNPPRYKIQTNVPRYRVLTAKSRIPGSAGNTKPGTRKPNIIITEVKTIKPPELKVCNTPEKKTKEKEGEDLREQVFNLVYFLSSSPVHSILLYTIPTFIYYITK